MAGDNYKIINFEFYCPLCEHANVDEQKDPCNECLAIGAMPNSSKPINFKEKT